MAKLGFKPRPLDLQLGTLSNALMSLLNSRKYGKNPKISYTKNSDKMAYANSIDPDQTAPEGAV